LPQKIINCKSSLYLPLFFSRKNAQKAQKIIYLNAEIIFRQPTTVNSQLSIPPTSAILQSTNIFPTMTKGHLFTSPL